jgi:voltage-gated potassium channel
VSEELAPTTATPIEELNALVTWGAMLFYWAEVGQNPTVTTYFDALHYIATSLSVGYANIFPCTALGKAIGAAVMMVGPALSARALESGQGKAGADSDPALIAKMDEILVELRKLNAR